MILPRPKELKTTEDFFNKEITLDMTDEKARSASEIIKYFMPTISTGDSKTPNFFLIKEYFEIKGTYRLIVLEEDIKIHYGDYEGLRNALASLSQLKTEQGFECVEIYDFPDNEYRSCLLDLARGYVGIPQLKEHLTRMALLKCSYVHFHLMDQQSYILESDVIPNPAGNKTYSKAEMRDIIEFCKKLSLEIVPEIEIPGHAVNQIRALPELQCDIINIEKAFNLIKKAEHAKKMEYTDLKKNISVWTICVGKESTYEIFDKIIKELCELFDGKYLHIGADEPHVEQMGAFPHWDNCHACKKRMEEEGLKTNFDLYLYSIRRINEIVKSYGKKTIIWNDEFDLSNIDLPRDIIIEYWIDQTETPGLYQKIVDQGFETINANFAYVYMNLDSNSKVEKLQKWHTHVEFLDKDLIQGGVMGGEMCAWELGNPQYCHYAYSLPATMTFFADKVWNSSDVEHDEEYLESVFSLILGKNKAKINPFAFLKNIIPSAVEKSMLEEIEFDSFEKSKLETAISEIKKIDESVIYGKFALKAYIDALEMINNVKV